MEPSVGTLIELGMLIPCDYCGTVWDTDRLDGAGRDQIVRCRYCAWLEEKAENLLREAESIVAHYEQTL